MATLGRWCFRHRFLVLVLWIFGLGGLVAAGAVAGTQFANSFALPGTDSNQGLVLLAGQSAGQAGDQDSLVWHTSSGTVRDPRVRARMTGVLDRIATMPEVAAVRSPYAPGGGMQISRDGTTAYAVVAFDAQPDKLADADVDAVIGAARAAGTATLDVQVTGGAVDQASRTALSSSEGIGILAAAVVLFLAFGSLFATVLPIITAVFGLGVGLTAVDLLTHAFSIGSLAPTLSALIGLGVGIDYAIFIVTRHRRNLMRGLPGPDAAALALDTSGRAVLFAGGTVCIALLGMLVLGVSFLNGVAIAAAITVVCTVLSAVTLLPALLGLLGPRVLSRRQRRRLAQSGLEPAEATGFWAGWARFVQKRPATLALAAAAVLAVLVVPIHALFLGHSDDGTAPSASTSRKAYDLLSDGFGAGFNAPLQVVVQFGPGGAGAAQYAKLTTALAHAPDVAEIQAAPPQTGAALAVAQVIPASSPDSEATSDLIGALRSDVIPKAVSGAPLRVYVTGNTAIYYDFGRVLDSKLPEFIGVIVALGFLLLLLAFRSLAIPATAAVMNLLGAGAAFGLLVWVFEWGHGLGALGLGSPGPIESFLPVVMISVLFGLSMDYQVFLVSRMHEEWEHSHDTHRAVRAGQAETGRVITAAAAIMICVFMAFVFGGQRAIAEFGVGLACAVALDAFVIRTVLVPAAMQVLGRANWYLPPWLDRALPHLSIDPPDREAAHAAGEDSRPGLGEPGPADADTAVR